MGLRSMAAGDGEREERTVIEEGISGAGLVVVVGCWMLEMLVWGSNDLGSFCLV